MFFKRYIIKKYLKKVIRVILIVMLLEIAFGNQKLESDNEVKVNNVEENIEEASKNIVGISKNVISAGQKSISWGSGIVVSKNGYILTNEHVSGSISEECYVILEKDKRYKANIVWSNTDLDLAILKINYVFESCAILGDSNELKKGQSIYAIGNPISIDFEKSVTKGIVSGMNRNLEFEENGQKIYLNNLIQTDASINPGNSGGALINTLGNVVGVSTVKISSAESMGYAIPINIVKPIIFKLNNNKKIEEPTLKIYAYDKYSINKLNLNIDLNSGVYIAKISSGSNIEKAGVKVGDIIVSVDEKEMNSIIDLKEYLFGKNIGDTIVLKIKRKKSEYYIRVCLEKNG